MSQDDGNNVEDRDKQNVSLRPGTSDDLAEMYPDALNTAERIRMAIADAKRFIEGLE